MDDEQIRRFRGQLKLLQRRLRREVVPVSGLTRTAMQVLGAIERLPAGVQPGTIATDLRLAGPNVAAALRELGEVGFVQRERDPDDGRRVRLAITDAGAAASAELRRERATWLGRAVDAVLDGEEQRTLAAAGDLLERLAAYDPEPSAKEPSA